MVERVEGDLGRWVGEPLAGRGLWAALDASFDQLAPGQQDVLVALAVMVGDADLDLIAAVAGVPAADAFDALAALVDASLVHVRSGTGRGRYELLRTVSVRSLDRGSSADVAQAARVTSSPFSVVRLNSHKSWGQRIAARPWNGSTARCRTCGRSSVRSPPKRPTQSARRPRSRSQSRCTTIGSAAIPRKVSTGSGGSAQ